MLCPDLHPRTEYSLRDAITTHNVPDDESDTYGYEFGRCDTCTGSVSFNSNPDEVRIIHHSLGFR